MKRKLYVYSISAVRVTESGGYQFSATCGICTAYSEEEAYGRAMKNALLTMPKDEGHYDHGANVLEATEMIKRWIVEFNL